MVGLLVGDTAIRVGGSRYFGRQFGLEFMRLKPYQQYFKLWWFKKSGFHYTMNGTGDNHGKWKNTGKPQSPLIQREKKE